MFYIYILKNYYQRNYFIGTTRNLEKRYKEHLVQQQIKDSEEAPFELVYVEEYRNVIDALKRERELKKRSTAEMRKLIQGLSS